MQVNWSILLDTMQNQAMNIVMHKTLLFMTAFHVNLKIAVELQFCHSFITQICSESFVLFPAYFFVNLFFI